MAMAVGKNLAGDAGSPVRDATPALLRHLFTAGLNGASPEALADILVEGIETSFDGVNCRVAIAAADGSPLVIRESRRISNRFSIAAMHASSDDPLRAVGTERIDCADTRAETRWLGHAGLCLVNGIKAFIVEPLMIDGRRRGAIAVYTKADLGDMGVDANLMNEFAEGLSLAIRARPKRQSERAAGDALRSLSQMIPGVVYQRMVTPGGDIRYTYISEGAREIFGVEPERILNDPEALFQHYDEDYRRTFRAKLIEASREMRQWDVEATIRLPDGRVRFTHAIARPQKLADGSVLWTGVILDAGRIKEAEAAAAAVEANTRNAIVESLTQGILLFDADDRLVVANSHFLDLYPRMREVVRPGLKYDDFVRHESAHLFELGQIGEVEVADRAQRVAYRDKRASISERSIGEDKWIMVTESHDSVRGSVILYTDVSELKLRERRIHHLAFHDSLTGLPNRSSFRNRLNEALEKTWRGEGSTAVLCLDLDCFKFVNDTLGHPMGDRLLNMVSRRLQSVIRPCDVVARLGGDEFAIVVDKLPSADYATSLAWRLLDIVGQPYDLDGQHVVSTTSIGIAVARAGEQLDADELIKNSDMALYRAKADGRNAFRFFEKEMDARAQQRRLLEHDLRAALDKDELELFYQPLVDVFSEEVTGMEALMRWRHPVRGLVPPGEFISLAEETGLIIRMGAWVIRRACADAVRWPGSVRVAVNVSPAQFFKRDLVEIVASALRESGLDPGRLEIEITESLLLRDTASNLSTLQELKALGVRISMDDFGTGYSSLANLRSFPFDKIKIDKSFVDGLELNTDSAAIVRAVLSLGRGLGMTTTAEGVETRDQLAYLRSEGCIEVQGYYFSEPMEQRDVATYLERGPQSEVLRAD